MKTRFTQLVKYKDSEMQKCERELLHVNNQLGDAKEKLQNSYEVLSQLQTPQEGEIRTFVQSRTSLTIQRDIIKQHTQEVDVITNRANQAKETLKLAMIEYEKFKYLEAEQIKKIMKKRQEAEVKELDEAALQTFIGKKR
ncbi:MAG: flagellar export protein FliJ [Campylobacterota bacterium]|nr:flagellar export protein FliJ [Campylobacterota bacterium]